MQFIISTPWTILSALNINNMIKIKKLSQGICEHIVIRNNQANNQELSQTKAQGHYKDPTLPSSVMSSSPSP